MLSLDFLPGIFCVLDFIYFFFKVAVKYSRETTNQPISSNINKWAGVEERGNTEAVLLKASEPEVVRQRGVRNTVPKPDETPAGLLPAFCKNIP